MKPLMTPESLGNAYSYRELKAALWKMNGGPVGFDLYRDDRTRAKLGLAKFILDKFGTATVEEALPLEASGKEIHAEARSTAGGGGGGGGPERGGKAERGGKKAGKGGDEGDAADGEPREGDAADGEPREGEAGDEGSEAEVEFKPEEGAPGEDPISKAIREKLNERLEAMHKQMQERMKNAEKRSKQALKQAQKNAGKAEPTFRGIEVKVPGKPPVKMEGHQHPIFDEVLALASDGKLNIMLKGPAGCGKTHLFGMVNTALGRTGESISGSAGASESQLLGRLLPTGDGGRFEYHVSPFIRMYEGNQTAFLFDEFDAFDPNMLIVTNQATANGGFTCELRQSNTHIKRGDCLLMAAANTFGTGADALYVGRNQLDAATLDRWVVLEMDYDTAFEATLGPKELVEWVWKIRQGINTSRLRRVMSTRAIQKGANMLEKGLKLPRVKEILLAGWTRDEQAKVGV